MSGKRAGPSRRRGAVAAILFGLALAAACSQAARLSNPAAGQAPIPRRPADVRAAALRTYVPPGERDEYYMFASGGHSGQIRVYGIPSMRLIRTIPVFRPDSATGWGFDAESRRMLGGFRWGDLHHPALSETDGKYDGRWLFASDMANNRVALIDLRTFRVKQILGPVPNIAGAHCSVFVTPDTEYLFMPSRFARPIPEGAYAPLSEFRRKYHGVVAAVAFDREAGEMRLAWEVLLPPWSYDMSDAGKGVSGGWAFFTTFNTEEATGPLEVGASQRDKDYIVALDWRAAERAVRAGNFTLVAGVRMVDPARAPGLVYLIPAPKSPHGVNVSPDGRYLVLGGKLAPTVTVLDFERIRAAIDRQDFSGEVGGLPVLRLEGVRAAEVPVGLGALHTEFGENGYAYTTLFLDSAVAKWRLGTWKVVDKVKVQYNPGHVSLPGGDTAAPEGGYLVSLNKMSRDRFLPVGLTRPDSLQLFDVSGPKMRLLYEAPADPEPHYAPIIRADLLKPMAVLRKDERRPGSVWRPQDARIVREGDTVHVYGVMLRTRFVPDKIEVNQGDRVVLHWTNIEQTEDLPHGFGILLYDINVQVEAGETRTVELVADRAGVFPFYCTNFCSAYHEEMTGWLLVKPAGS